MPILDDQLLAELAARRYALPPTVMSTGDNSPMLRPGNSVPLGSAPAGAIPSVGLGEMPPQSGASGFDEAGFLPPPAAASAPAPAPAMPSWMAGAQAPTGILNGAMSPPPPPPISLAPPPPSAAAMPPAATLTSGSGGPVPDTSLMGRLAEAGKRIGQAINDHPSTLMALGGGLAGAPSIGVGIGRGLTAAVPASQLDQKIGNQNQTARALLARGIPADVAAAAASNPAMLAQLLPQVFGAKALQHVTVKDRLGNEIPLTFDPASGKYKTATGEPYGTPNASGLSSTGDPTKTGAEYLATLDPMTRNEVQAFGEGRAPVTARNLQQMLPLVTQAYPGFDASKYPVMLATRKSYTSGKDFAETQALNTVGGHMLKLADAAEALPNTTVPLWNKGMNWFKDTFTGNPAMTRFRNDLVTTSNELAKAYHGGHVSDASYAAFQKGINEAQTPAEMKTAIGEIAGLLKSKIEAKESGYRSSMGDAPLPSEFKATNDEARHAFSKINDWALGIKPTAPAAPAPAAPLAPAAPVPPGKYVYDPARGLVPAP